MLEGLYSAAAGMQAQQQRIDSVANDLANVNTNGYKHDARGLPRPAVRQRRLAATCTAAPARRATTIGRGFAQGAMRETGNPLDVAIEGEGFLRVRRADGTDALTRDGSLRIDAAGPPRHPARRARPAGDHRPGRHERVRRLDRRRRHGHREQPRARQASSSSTSARPRRSQTIGDNLYRTTAASGAATNATGARLTQGSVEASNVDVGDSMTEMIDAQRSYQLASRAVQMQDQMLQIANQVKS